MNIDELFYRKLKFYSKVPKGSLWNDIEKHLPQESTTQTEQNFPAQTFPHRKRTWRGIGLGVFIAITLIGILAIYHHFTETDTTVSKPAQITTQPPLENISLQDDNIKEEVQPSKYQTTPLTIKATPSNVKHVLSSSVNTDIDSQAGHHFTDTNTPPHRSVRNNSYTPSTPMATHQVQQENTPSLIATLVPTIPQEPPTTVSETTPIASPVSEEEPTTLSPLEKEMETHLRIPNFISPNFDGQNDFFRIAGLEYFPKHELKIFTQHGTVLLHTKQYDQNWAAENVPNGVYFYILKVEKETQSAIRRGVIHVER